ncbi:MAG TPA: hypothetical protein VE377_19430 [Candidatus Dormibacteraeota bacterium]|nr:hypothetical protein [Candidatus Dormibacteraeota bacterium]
MRPLLMLLALLAVMAPAAPAQDDPNETPLGDVARNMRKKNPPGTQVIDDDNLSLAMEQAASPRPLKVGLRFLMVGDSKGFQVSAPDATCSLSFTANVKALLSNQYAQMQLPPGEMAKLEGQAAVEGDALTVPVFNGTQWHLSELAVAFTLVKKAENRILLFGATPEPVSNPFQQVRPEKKADVTVIYRMRAAAPPWAKTTFSAPLNLELSPGEEWHWAILEAKGYPPETYAAQTAQGNAGESTQPSLTLKSTTRAPDPVEQAPQSPQ